MSRVTNLVVIVGSESTERANLEALSAWLSEHRESASALTEGYGWGSLKSLTRPSQQWGGYKGPECSIWAGTLNWADVDAVLSRIFETPWIDRDQVQVLIRDQG